MCSPHLRNDQQVRGARQQATQQKPKSPCGNLFSHFPKFHLTRTPTQLFNTPVPPDKRGVRTSRTRGGMRWPLNAQLTRAHDADGEVVWT